jgi:hypothetical protein
MENMNNKNIPSDVSIKIFEVVGAFNFENVIKVMDCLDWQYGVPSPHYPDEQELSNKAFKYLIDVYNGFWGHEDKHEKYFVYEVSTGGFEYSYWYDFENEQHNFGIKFIVEEYREF